MALRGGLFDFLCMFLPHLVAGWLHQTLTALAILYARVFESIPGLSPLHAALATSYSAVNRLIDSRPEPVILCHKMVIRRKYSNDGRRLLADLVVSLEKVLRGEYTKSWQAIEEMALATVSSGKSRASEDEINQLARIVGTDITLPMPSLDSQDAADNLEVFKALSSALDLIVRYAAMRQILESRQRTALDKSSDDHKATLSELWHALKSKDADAAVGDVPFVSEYWKEIGFQGSDPSTDLRGAGMLSLDDLVYFAQNYPAEARFALESSNHPVSWYPFATFGINLTGFITNQLIADNYLQLYLYAVATDESFVQVYREVYSFLFREFNSLWITPPLPNADGTPRQRTVMDFGPLFARFGDKVKNTLMLSGNHPPPMSIRATSAVDDNKKQT